MFIPRFNKQCIQSWKGQTGNFPQTSSLVVVPSFANARRMKTEDHTYTCEPTHQFVVCRVHSTYFFRLRCCPRGNACSRLPLRLVRVRPQSSALIAGMPSTAERSLWSNKEGRGRTSTQAVSPTYRNGSSITSPNIVVGVVGEARGMDDGETP